MTINVIIDPAIHESNSKLYIVIVQNVDEYIIDEATSCLHLLRKDKMSTVFNSSAWKYFYTSEDEPA